MKKINLSIFSLLTIVGLTSCAVPLNSVKDAQGAINDNSELTEIQDAISVLRETNYTATLTEKLTVVHPNNKQSVDIGTDTTRTLNFKVGDDEGVSTSAIRQSYDLDKTTHEKVDSSTTTYRTQTLTYFKDESTGSAYTETIDLNNEYKQYYVSDYDESTRVYQPISYESEFRNPWDFIDASDIDVNEDGEYVLSNQKAQFLINCYQASNLNWVQKAVINIDNGKIISLAISTPDQKGSNSSASNYWIRTTSYSLNFTNYGHEDLVKHLPKNGYENNNPELQAIFDSVKTADSFTYKKLFVGVPPLTQNPVVDEDSWTTGYFTKDAVYYAQMYEDKNHDGKNDYERTYDNGSSNLQSPYMGTDNYDSIIHKEDDGKYYVYQYTPGNVWNWGRVALSGSTDYSFDNFGDIGPNFGNLSAKLFKKTGDKTYEIEDQLVSYSGTFFDNQYQGVSTTYFESQTTKLILTINDDKSLSIDTGYWSNGKEQEVKFELYDINSTTLASWMQTEINKL